MMRFWLDRGCDGFRVRLVQSSWISWGSTFLIHCTRSVKMDVINLLSKTDGLPDAPVVDENDSTQPASMHYANGPRVHEYIKEMNQKVLSRKLPSASSTTSGTHRVTQTTTYSPSGKHLSPTPQMTLQNTFCRRTGNSKPFSNSNSWILTLLTLLSH